MNVTTRDIAILIVMALAITSMSFVMPAMGLTSSKSTNASDIPDLSVNASRFDFAGEFPREPSTPDSGNLYYNSSLGGDSANQVWLDGDTSGGTELVLLENGTGTGASNSPKVNVNDWNSGTATTDEYSFSSRSDVQVHRNFSYEIRLKPINVSDDNTPFEYQVYYEVEDAPETGGFFNLQDTAGFIGYLGNVVFWFVQTLFTVVVNLLFLLFDSLTLFISVVTWLASTYGGIVASASGFAKVFVSIPGIILSGQLAKFVLVGLSLLPTT